MFGEDRKIKILYLIYDHIRNPWVGGGGAVRAYEICRKLASYGHEVTVLSGRFPGAHDYREGDLHYRFVGSERNYMCSTFSFAFRAAAFVKKHGSGFDVVIEDFAPWNPVFSRFLTNTPAVLHVNHKEGFTMLKRWFIAGIPFYLLEAFYAKLFRYVTALSPETREKMRIPEAVIVPAAVSPDLFRVNDDSEGADLLFVGRLHIMNKGLDTLMGAMRILKGISLLIVGRGKDERRLRKMAEDVKDSIVEFKGFVPEEDKINILKRSKVFVLPSRYEGQGIVILEAAACGKPVVVSDIPELRYAVDAGFGLSFETGDPKDLADKLNVLLQNACLRKEMGIRAREYAQNFTWDRIAEEYEKYLLRIKASNKQ